MGERDIERDANLGAVDVKRSHGKLEQIWPGYYTIQRKGLECGRILVYGLEERWIMYTNNDPAGSYGEYVPISPNSSKAENTLALVLRNGADEQFIYDACKDITYFTDYRRHLPNHSYVSWSVTNETSYTGTPDVVYKVFQGDGTTHDHVGYAVLLDTAQHWLLFSADAPDGAYKKFQRIGKENYREKGSLQFERSGLPTPLPEHTYVKCVTQ